LIEWEELIARMTREATRIPRSLFVASARDSVGRDPLKLVYTGVLKGWMIQAIGGQRYLRNEGSVQSATGPTGEKKSFDMNRLDRRIAVAPMMDWTDAEGIA
jgi:hypothetical protein